MRVTQTPPSDAGGYPGPPPFYGPHDQPQYGEQYGEQYRASPDENGASRPSNPQRKALLIGAAAGFALAAAIALVLAVTGALPSSSNSLNSSSDSIALPATVGNYRFEIDALKARNGPGAAAIIRYRTTSRERSAAALSKASGGAGADVRFYASSDLRSLATIAAVRADSPRLTTVYDDPKSSGLAVPLQRIQTFGSVDYLVIAVIPTPAGQTPGHRILRMSGVDGVPPKQIAALVDTIWATLH